MLQVVHMDCLAGLRMLPDNFADSIVTDPPYELTASKRTVPAPHVEGSPFSRHRVGVNGDTKPVGGFMGKEWDGTGIAFSVELWSEVLRVLKPGGHLLAFSGSRTYHRMACAIEDAGFEIRDQIMWLYGSGFPKSRSISGDMTGSDAEKWKGWGTALKPAHEPITVARKPLEGTVAANVLAHGVGGLNIDACRVGDTVETWPKSRSFRAGISSGYTEGLEKGATQETGEAPAGRWPANIIHDGSDEVLGAFPQAPGQQAPNGKRVQGSVYGKVNDSPPRQPIGDSGSAARFFYCAKASQSDRNSGLNGIERVTIQLLKGESWEHADQQAQLLVDTAHSPPKVIGAYGCPLNDATEWSTMLFGSEPTGRSPLATTSTIETRTNSTMSFTTLSYFQSWPTSESTGVASGGGTSGGSPVESVESSSLSIVTTNAKMASALGVEPAASRMRLKISVSAARSGHPTVKPADLMRYLCRLVTPPGGMVLDPFTGSGSTGKAAKLEGFKFIGFEREAEYVAIARARIASAK